MFVYVCRSDKFEEIGSTFPKFEGLSERSLVNVIEANNIRRGKMNQNQIKVDKKVKDKKRHSDTSDLEDNLDENHSDNGTFEVERKRKGKHKHGRKKTKSPGNKNTVSNHCCDDYSIVGR